MNNIELRLQSLYRELYSLPTFVAFRDLPAVNQRRANLNSEIAKLERQQLEKPERWVLIELKHCSKADSTLWRHAQDNSKPYIRRGEHGYQVLESHLPVYIKPHFMAQYLNPGD